MRTAQIPTKVIAWAKALVLESEMDDGIEIVRGKKCYCKLTVRQTPDNRGNFRNRNVGWS